MQIVIETKQVVGEKGQVEESVEEGEPVAPASTEIIGRPVGIRFLIQKMVMV